MYYSNHCIELLCFRQQTDEADPRYIATITIAVFCLVGFLFFDLLYVAVIVNYCSQCQLLHYYVVNVTEKIRHKAYALGDAVKVRTMG